LDAFQPRSVWPNGVKAWIQFDPVFDSRKRWVAMKTLDKERVLANVVVTTIGSGNTLKTRLMSDSDRT